MLLRNDSNTLAKTLENLIYLFLVAEFEPVSASECPCTNSDPSGCNLPECSSDTDLNALCEADQVLPDTNPNYDVNNCPGGYDVFTHIRKGSLLKTNTVLLCCYGAFIKFPLHCF